MYDTGFRNSSITYSKSQSDSHSQRISRIPGILINWKLQSFLCLSLEF